jgi:hypothetical protein
MRHRDLEGFMKSARTAIGAGPAALIFVEDAAEVDRTIRHHRAIGFTVVVVFGPETLQLPAELAGDIHYVPWNMGQDAATETAVNRVIAACPGAWLYYCYNAEFLFFPFCETRTVGEMLAFHTEERRDAMLTYVVDLYAPDLHATPDGVSVEAAHIDRAGYFALERPGPAGPVDRQLDFYGGLRWRFEEHIPEDRRRIDRIGLFRAKAGLRLRENHTFTDEEYNTYACPWHHNLTAAICSFRAAKALRTNAASRFAVDSFLWHSSTPFDWTSRQLLDLGLMETGQWF